MVTRLDALKLAATGTAGLFCGGAVYINVVEHGARMKIKDTASLRTEWKESFLKAKNYVGGMGLLAAAFAGGVFYLDASEDRWLWLAGAGTSMFNGPYTKFVMIPDIMILLDDNVIQERGEKWVRDNLVTWNKRHMVRSAISLAVFGTFLYGLWKK